MEELTDFNEPQEESNFDLKAEIFKYLTHWKWLVLGLILGGSIAYLYNRYTVASYRSEASLMILKSDQNNASGILPSSGSGGASIIQLQDNSLQNQIVTLRSKRLVKKVVDVLDHNISYYIEGNVITTEAYKTSPIVIEFVTPDSIVDKFSSNFTIDPTSNLKFDSTNNKTRFEKILETKPRFVLPGKLIHVYRTGRGYASSYVKPDMFDEIAFSRTMIDDHFTESYTEALNSLVQHK